MLHKCRRMHKNRYADWLWCPGFSPVLVSIALPFAFHRPTWCFPFALICHWISIVFLHYGRRIATHSVDPSLTHFLGEFPGFGLALVPDGVVPEAEQRSRKLDPNFCPGRGRTPDLGIQRLSVVIQRFNQGCRDPL